MVVFDRNSTVVDGGSASRCLDEDARGRERPLDGNDDGAAQCDVGAYELSGEKLFADGFEG